MEIVVDRTRRTEVVEILIIVVSIFIIGFLIGYFLIRETPAEKMLKAAEFYRRSFVMKIENDIGGICTSAAFIKGLHDHEDKVKRGEIKEWEKVVVYAQPTFTFAGSKETQRPIHTGDKNSLEIIIRPLIASLTGIDPGRVSNKDYKKAVSVIFERDSRLFVPYAGLPSEGEKQFAFYGKPTITQAVTDLNRSVGL